MNTTETYNTTFQCYGIVQDVCTPKSCTHMTAGPKFEYIWREGKDSVQLSAPAYIDKLCGWVHQQLNDPAIFSSSGVYGKNMTPTCSKILTRLFRVYAHMYYSHWKELQSLDAVGLYNSCFQHFYFFATEFKLVDPADMAPLQPLIEAITK
eukprot:TRINITY_DN1740_c0_g1_i1.p1 TRINITY_DN1740_c0_g1~~TRINITY_DN1740_c0_g1_i1.p1  ORF type:complete len:151 (-),score=32.90 TRINITY_DN1740_c0_g1_i1:98-550(-)